MERVRQLKVRRLTRADLDPVVALDAALSGRTRRAYFERRLAAALRQPELHVQYAVEEEGVLCGYALARVLEGEFGLARPALRLEVIGVRSDAQGRGVGRALHGALEQEAGQRAVGEIRTVAGWRDHAMLGFLGRLGYALAPSLVLECARLSTLEETPPEPRVRRSPGDPNDFSALAADDFEKLARDAVHVRLLTASDFDELVCIDRRVSGRDRHAYMRHALDEALRESGVRVSLAAIMDGVMAGFIMAHADLGDFGRTEPVAIIDAIGVDPDYQREGAGQALLSQLFLNLAALRVERVETVVAMQNLELLGFFHGAGFAPGQRLAFVKQGGR